MLRIDIAIGGRVVGPAGRKSFKRGTVIEINEEKKRAKVDWDGDWDTTWMKIQALSALKEESASPLSNR